MASESLSGPLQTRSVKAHKFTAHPYTPLPIFLRRVLFEVLAQVLARYMEITRTVKKKQWV